MNKIFYTGVVENRNDPLKIGRCQIRIHGLHTGDKTLLPTSALPWAELLIPVALGAGVSGVGVSPTGIVKGTTVLLIFKDDWQQQPVILGVLQGAPQSLARPSPTQATIINQATTASAPQANMTTTKLSDLQPPCE
jgi:hypothetical protein